MSDAFHAAEARRVALDAAIVARGPEDPGRDALWLELEATLQERRRCVRDLASTPAPTLSDAREKARIARLLLQPQLDGAGEEPELVRALARSALDDLLALGIA